MPLRVELGALTVEVERQEDAAALLRSLCRRLNAREVAELLGVTDKTVRRWRELGRLPGDAHGHFTLMHLLDHLVPPARLLSRTARRGRAARPLAGRVTTRVTGSALARVSARAAGHRAEPRAAAGATQRAAGSRGPARGAAGARGASPRLPRPRRAGSPRGARRSRPGSAR
jgi:Homeodomain-like domain